MKTVRKRNYGFGVIFLLMVLMPFAAFADKSSVNIEAPDQAPLNSDITIVLNVSHHGNNFMHHTNWLYLKINGEEIKRWEFGAFSKPEQETFTREFTYRMTGPIQIEAEANCNIHGSKGISETSIDVQ